MVITKLIQVGHIYSLGAEVKVRKVISNLVIDNISQCSDHQRVNL